MCHCDQHTKVDLKLECYNRTCGICAQVIMDVDKLKYACLLWTEIRGDGTDVQLEIEVGILRF